MKRLPAHVPDLVNAGPGDEVEHWIRVKKEREQMARKPDPERLTPLPAGWYRVVVTTIEDASNYHPAGLALVLTVTRGPLAGHQLRDVLFDPERLSGEDDGRRHKQRLALWLACCGAYSRERLYGAFDRGNLDALVGREVVVQVVEGGKVAFDGVYGIADARVPEEV